MELRFLRENNIFQLQTNLDRQIQDQFTTFN